MSENPGAAAFRHEGADHRHLHAVSSAPEPAADTGTTDPAWAARLSNREIEVLRCLADGLSTREIAQALSISTSTVKSHVARLLVKVDVRDRLQVVTEAYRTGFVSVD